MATSNDQKSADEPREEELEFIVMPQGGGPAKPPSVGKRRHLGVLLVVLILILGSLGGLVYWRYPDILRRLNFSKARPLSQPEISLPEVQEQTVDSDMDGLTDKQEFDLALNPQKADSDGDGLADSDEINVYGSDPLLPDTDNDGFDDGREVAGGYSPVSTSLEKASSEELQLWTQRLEQYGLHEPTKTTLTLKGFVPGQKDEAYVNRQYGYRLVLPAVLTYREAEEQRVVGFHVTGTVPADDDPATDPISVSVAVKTPGQTLEDWSQGLYPPADYGKAENLAVNNVQALRLRGVKAETCPQDKTFFPQQSLVIILTWTCNENTPFGPIYERIISSFEFLP